MVRTSGFHPGNRSSILRGVTNNRKRATLILVTGGAGFIGSHLVDKLIRDGFSVRVIDNESATENDTFYWNPQADNHRVDISDYSATRSLFDGIEVVYHLAAISRIQPAIKNPDTVVETNLVGTQNALRCATEAGVQRFVFSSSSSIYGNNDTPNVESQDPDCLNTYSSSKLSGSCCAMQCMAHLVWKQSLLDSLMFMVSVSHSRASTQQ